MPDHRVPLTTLTERPAPGGGMQLTGRLGDAVVVAMPIAPRADGARRWRLIVLEPSKPRHPQRGLPITPAEWDALGIQSVADWRPGSD